MAYETAMPGLPWSFWNATPADFRLWVDGYEVRRAEERYLVAWQTAYLLRSWAGKKGKTITPEKLLGLKKQARDETPDQLAERLKREFAEGNS